MLNKDEQASSRLLTEKEVAKMLSISTKKLQKDRLLSRGIKYIKIGEAVRYSSLDLEQYLLENTYPKIQ